MELVFVVGGYYPRFSATGNCIRKIVFELQPSNSIRIISELKDLGEADTEIWNEQIITRVSTKRIKRRLMLKKKNNNFLLMMHKIRWFLSFLKNQYGFDIQMVNAYLKILEKYNNEKIIDAIIPCCMPIEAVYACYIFAKKHPTTYYYPVLFDLYADSNIFFRNNFVKRIKRKKATSIQKQMLEKARGIFYVENWNSFFQEFPYDNAYLIEHPLINRIETTIEHLQNKKEINLIYQGEVNYEIRNPSKAMAVIELLLNMDFEHKLGFHFFAFGNAYKEIERIAGKFRGQIELYGKVTKTQADSFAMDADINVVFCNSNSQIVPSKIYECISSGKPLVYFTSNIDDLPCRILMKYDNKIIFNLSEISNETVSNLFTWIVSNYNRRIAFEDLDDSYLVASAENVANIIKGVITIHE